MDLLLHFNALIVFFSILAYLLGSVPTAVWMGKWLRGLDVRDHGSGNAGATNAMRVLGPKIGLVVLLLDALKAIAAVSMALFIKEGFYSEELFVMFQLFLGALVITGHVFPVFASFRGGKGIASLLGIVFVLFPEAFLICLVVFLAVFFSSRYVSLASLAAAVALPIIVIVIKDVTLVSKVVFAVIVALFVPVVHINNIKRLIQGTENRISFRR